MKPPPIRVRLTAWYLVVISTALTVSFFAVYFGIQRAIEDTVDTQLEARSDTLIRFLEHYNPPRVAAGSQPLPAEAALGPGDQLYQISDVSGAMLFQSPAMRELQVPLDVNQLYHHYRHHRDQGNFTTYYRRSSDVRVLASLVQLQGNAYRIQVATDVNPFYEILETFRKWSWAGLPLIVCLAGLGGYWLTGRAMKPVHDLVHSTRDISEHSLSRRIPVPAAQDELRQLAETINAMLARLESAFTRVTRFTADASHELRTPITVIRTTAEVILERERSSAELREMVGLILRESESTSTLIEQLLTLARTDADTEQLNLEELELRSLLAELDASSRVLAESRSLQWTMEVPDQPVVIHADQANLRRMLLILIENACRYTEPNGSVRLSLRVQKPEALIEVTDTGIGIPPEELTHIFDRFYRASNARFFDPEGTGLGLPIARWIATSHGGTLTAQSTLGRGTCMAVRLRLSGNE
ncbi:sensor histidine kinase [Acidisarcina polymorpha]|uniref:histidine kinase n=1 Tax=Acidisarcina polymorpha TaxID=2211140 RepID=A0A2Z5FYK8_9BACT|nr:ATP-binding protein [Acidisarcina polymorpha]AXC11604.1 sensor histidine kinase [Acidisarcina polymorpha]